MAKKGTIFSTYTIEFKNEVINAYKSGKYGGRDQVARHYNINSSTIYNWIVKDRKQGNQINDINNHKGHYKRPITLEDWKERYEILKKYQAFLKERHKKK